MTSQEAGTLGRQGSLPSFPYDPFGVEAYPGTLSSQAIARVVESYAGTTSRPSSPRVDTGSYSPQSISQSADLFGGFGGNQLVGHNGRGNGVVYGKESAMNGHDMDSRDLVMQQHIEQHEHMLQLQRLKLRQQQIQDYQEQQQLQHLSELKQLQEQQVRGTRRSTGFGDMKRSSGQVSDVDGRPVPSVPRSKDTALVGLMAKIVPVAISSWLSRALLTASLMKKVRPEGVALAPGVYPQRPGEKECAFYMRTGTCAFGTSCKFDHPAWLPAGGIPNWKEGSGLEGVSPFPERPGEPDCAYYIKTGDCKFGGRCKFHHPKDRPASHMQESSGTPTGGMFPPISPTSWGPGGSPFDPRLDDAALSQTAGAALAVAVNGNSNGNSPTSDGYAKGAYGRPAPLNSKGLPIRADEPDCSFYGKTGSCKFGALCKFNHPEGVVPTSPLVSSQQQSMFSQGLGFGSNGGSLDYQLLAAASGLSSPLPGSPLALHMYPERPGQVECAFFLKTGTCKYGTSCKFNHPKNRFSTCGGNSGMSSPVSHHTCVTPGKSPPPVKLTLAGLPRREDEPLCGYYMKTGACKFGSTCKFDHPPPGEAAAKAAAAALQKEGGGSMSDSDLSEVLTETTADRGTAL